MSSDQCRALEVDGETIRIRGEVPIDQLSDEERAMLADIVRAAKRKAAELWGG